MRKFLAVSMALAMVLAVAGCGGSSSTAPEPTPAPETPAASPATTPTPEPAPASTFAVGMVTDVGGVNDQSFNQSAWEGLKAFEASTGSKVGYLESKQEADYGPNLDRMIDEDYDLIWGVGFMMADGMKNAATTNPDCTFAIVDQAYEDGPSNLTGVMFRAQEPSFLVGYIAGKMTATDHVGYIGGIKSELIDQFEYGYRAGVAYAAKELGKEIQVDIQYAESFGDSAKGKAIAQKMYSDGADIVFHAAGNVGQGLFEAAVEANKFAIGVDQDQNHLAPDNIITSAMKKVGEAMNIINEKAMNGENVGGQNFEFGIKEGSCGIAPSSDKHVPADVLSATSEIEQKIIAGEIVPPATQEAFDAFVAAL